ncbi:MAG: low molecular weight phosphotyrosine protein phosphatase [Gammaproteobacteria bacterium]|nr:low molecular weight phosphotyrosine protein phosphatase [Gammaproteobacteria bacterium]
MRKVKVLFVCMGNICRSPTAHGVFRSLVQERKLQTVIDIDSAGTHAYHVGEAPDRRAQSTAKARGVDLSDLRARPVNLKDFDQFDYILAMDEDNYAILLNQCPQEAQEKVKLFLSFAPHLNRREVPDPYYGGLKSFENVYDMIEHAAKGLLADIEQRHLPKSAAIE